MNEFIINAAIATVLTLVKVITKNPTDKRKWRNAMLKVANAILAAYPEDEAFAEPVKQ